MRRIRIVDPDAIYHVSNRTQEAKFLLSPDPALNEIVYAKLERAVRIFGIELYAAVVMGNHFHLILRAPKQNLSTFMKYFQGTLSRAVNKLRNRYDAAVFPRRFASEPILDDASLERMLAYVLCNPVAAKLVANPGDYPGLTSFPQMMGVATEHPLTLAVPPIWRGLDADAVAEKLRQLVEPVVSTHALARRYPVMGAANVVKVKWWRRPRRPKRGRRAFCHGATADARRAYVSYANRAQTAYRTAVLAWRERRVVSFPYGTIPPGWARCVDDGPRMPCALRRAAPPPNHRAQTLPTPTDLDGPDIRC